MFTLKKTKKVFEKLNKMDRKQAYTIGAIVVVSIVAILMLFTGSSEEDESFEGFNSRGYDLAQMPFVNDEAEQFLLASKYPDMQENTSGFLYSAQEKEERQEEDEAAGEGETSDFESDSDSSYTDSDGSGADTYGGRSRGYGGYGGRGGGSKTEIGQLGSASMATAGGGGMNSYYGPSGDFRQFRKNDKGHTAPAQVRAGNDRQALERFRAANVAAARQKNNKQLNAGKALLGGDIKGMDAFKKDGSVDLAKLQEGGLELDTSAPPTTTDLDNIDKAVNDAAKKAEDKKKEENKNQREWWEDLLIDLAKQTITGLVDAFTDSIGDSIKGAMNGNAASRQARSQYGAELAGKEWNQLTPAEQEQLKKVNPKIESKWGKYSAKQRRKAGAQTAEAWNRGGERKEIVMGKSYGTTDSSNKNKNNE